MELHIIVMRSSFHWLISFGILTTLYLGSDAALAEGGVKAQTPQITVTGVRCVIPQPFCAEATQQSRTLTLQSAQTASNQTSGSARDKLVEVKSIRDFRVVPTDLERKDGLSIIPAAWITSQTDPATQLAPQKFLSLPVQFNLQAVPSSGEYSGTLFVEHSEGSVAIPVMLRVKDSWHLAIPLLVMGVALALLLAAYQADGFDRDDITVKVGQLRSLMRSETDGTTIEAKTAEIFQNKAESYLVDVATALDQKAWVEARKSFVEAQTVWNRWRKQRNAWVDLYEYVEEALGSHFGEDLPEESVYGKDLKSEIKRIKREMADCETPQKFSELLKPLKEKVQQFLAARRLYEKLNEMRLQMGDSGVQWQAALTNLEDNLNRLSLDDITGLTDWQKEATDLEQEMQGSQIRGAGDRSGSALLLPSIRSIPTAQTVNDQDEVRRADWRLRTYRIVGHGVAIALLGWVGFNQLYVSNPTFGANAIADYSSLLAWGFTAEVTRDSVAKVLQRFKLPGAGG